MQVQHDPRAGLARGGQRAPAERRLQVVRVHDARPARAHRRGDLPRLQPTAQQADRRIASADLRRRALQQLHRLAQPLADEPHEVFHDALLAAGRAVAVVQEQDHRSREPIR